MELKLLREIKGLTQKDISDMFDIPIRTLTSWETGARKMPEYLEKLLTERLLNMSQEEINEEKKYIVLELDKITGETVIFAGSKSDCVKYEDSKRKGLTSEQRITHDYSVRKYSEYRAEKEKYEKLNEYFESLADEEKNKTVKIGNKTYAKYVVDFYKKMYNAGGDMAKTIYGKKATYEIREVNNLGDYEITMTGHEMYKDQSWLVGDFDYMSSIERIENDKKMLLEIRED